jgi:hypothetical protein
MSRAATWLRLPVDVRVGLSESWADELQYIVDDVCHRFAGAPVDTVTRELLGYQRVRQLEPAAVRFLADAISVQVRPPSSL